MIKHMGERKAADSAKLISILKEMILDAANEPPYASPYIRTATINYQATGKWETTIELNASPNPISLAEFAEKVDKSIGDNRIRLQENFTPSLIVDVTPEGLADYHNRNKYDPISDSVEHQTTTGLTVRCIISMTQNKY